MSNLNELLFYLLEDDKVRPGKGYFFKDQLMYKVQKGIKTRADLIESQLEYESVLEDEIRKIKEDMDLTFRMIHKSLLQVPYQAFKKL